jgi:hypothetical protein
VTKAKANKSFCRHCHAINIAFKAKEKAGKKTNQQQKGISYNSPTFCRFF